MNDFHRYGRLASAFGDIVDSHVGLIEFVRENHKEPGGPNFFHYVARSCNTRAFTAHQNFRTSGGASTSRQRAVAKAVGEGIERYCSALYDRDSLPLGSYRSLGYPCVHPSEFALYTSGQYEDPDFPWHPFEETTSIRWCRAFDLGSACSVYVPACMVFMPYYFDPEKDDHPISQPISTGLACHLSLEEAQLGAICEVTERDAVMITWLGMLSPPQVNLETIPEPNADLIRRFQRAGYTINVLDLTFDHKVPTFLSVLRGGTLDVPPLNLAAASSLDSSEALRKSLEELAHTRLYCYRIQHSINRLVPDPANFASVSDQLYHLNMYLDPKNVSLAEFLLSSKSVRDFRKIPSHSTGVPKDDIKEILALLATVGYRVLSVDLTTPDVQSLGLHVVRCIIPGFHPLQMGHRNRVLGGQRLRTVPVKLGYRSSLDVFDNPAPHPYP